MSGRGLPNVVLIVLDSVRRDHVSAYGYERPTTPELDRIASQGTLYTNAYAASCWTLPSHASMFTGRLPSEHRTDLDTRWLSDSMPTIASRLRERGYRTACITCNGFVGSHTNLTRGFDTVVDVERRPGGSDGLLPRFVRGVHRRWKALTAKDRGAGRATRLASKWLQNGPRGAPFFLFMNYMDCHLPYALKGPERYRFVEDDARQRVDGLNMEPFSHMAGAHRFTEQDVTDLKALYDGALRMLDGCIGELDRTLRALGAQDDTLFLVTSDHGESFGEHDLFDHQFSLHQPLIHVPMVVRFPDGRAGGSVEDSLVHHIDILPSILGMIGDADELPGTGVRSLTGDSRELAFAEYLVPNVAALTKRFPDVDTSRFDRPLRCVTDGRYKLVAAMGERPLLFDLQTDPGETVNLAEGQPTIRARLEEALLDRLGGWPTRVTGGADLSGLAERLEALGYL